jgi:hypothetical protein
VRLWDEAYIPIDPVTLSLTDIGAFADRLAFLGQTAAAGAITTWLKQLHTTPHTFDTVPEWLLQASFEIVEQLVLEEAEEERRLVADAMVWLQGREVKLLRLDYKQDTMSITYRQSVPYNIEPLLIFDAGGQQGRALPSHGEVAR